jgi:hypothetical protein
MLEETECQLERKLKVDSRIAELAEVIEAFIHEGDALDDAQRVVSAVVSAPMRAAWLGHWFLKESRAMPCRWLLFGGRCGPSCLREREAHDLPWMDHVEVFHTPGRAYVIVSHPYDLDMRRLDEVKRLIGNGCRVFVSARSWYFYGSTVRVEMWSEAAWDEVERLQRDRRDRRDG